MVISGHQPELYHPGVWFKNFLIAKLGRRLNGLSLNIVIDHDLARSVSIAVPSAYGDSDGTSPSLVRSLRSFAITDPWRHKSDTPIPWEFAFSSNHESWKAFPGLVQSELDALKLPSALIGKVWDKVLQENSRGSNTATALTEARQSIERAHGVCNEDIPFSTLAKARRLPSFSES